jgi:hypothetical protein
VDWHHVDADPDRTFHFDADPDPGPDPTPSFTNVGKLGIIFLTLIHSSADFFGFFSFSSTS